MLHSAGPSVNLFLISFSATGFIMDSETPARAHRYREKKCLSGRISLVCRPNVCYSYDTLCVPCRLECGASQQLGLWSAVARHRFPNGGFSPFGGRIQPPFPESPKQTSSPKLFYGAVAVCAANGGEPPLRKRRRAAALHTQCLRIIAVRHFLRPDDKTTGRPVWQRHPCRWTSLQRLEAVATKKTHHHSHKPKKG